MRGWPPLQDPIVAWQPAQRPRRPSSASAASAWIASSSRRAARSVGAAYCAAPFSAPAQMAQQRWGVSDPARESQRPPQGSRRGRSRPTCQCHCLADADGCLPGERRRDPRSKCVQFSRQIVFKNASTKRRRSAAKGTASDATDVSSKGAVVARILARNCQFTLPGQHRIGPGDSARTDGYRVVVLCAGVSQKLQSSGRAFSPVARVRIRSGIRIEWWRAPMVFPVCMHGRVLPASVLECVNENPRRHAKLA